MPISKPFVIATSGPTIDGRTITPEWITQMAKHYDPKVYTAVANLEHYLSSLPDSVFGAYGKVVSLSTRETDILGETKLQLLAVVDANDQLIGLQKIGKKAFCSMEVLNNFIGKGVAYLSGLAFTDTPASVGTESMKFSLSGAPGERFAFAGEVELEFEREAKLDAELDAAPKASPGDTLFAKVMALLGLGRKDTDARFSDVGQAVETVALSQKQTLDGLARLEHDLAALGVTVTLNAEALQARKAEFAALLATLDATDDGTPQRPPATGGDGLVATDC